MGSQLNIGRLILEASDSSGDELSSAGRGDSSGLDHEDSLGPNVRARLKAGPSGVVSDVLEKGLEVPPGSDIAGMGAQKPEPPLVQAAWANVGGVSAA